MAREAGIEPCAYRKLDSAIEVMKAAEQRMRCDASDPLNRAREGRVVRTKNSDAGVVVMQSTEQSM
jgi:hypothetical protein